MQNLIFLLVISLLTASIEIDISVPSFPDISAYFNISDGLTQITVAVNFLGFCISSIIYGPASDVFGRRKIMLFGNAIMLVGAFGCAVAESIHFLLFARFIQGLGASTSVVVAFAMIADRYSASKASRLFGTMNGLITIFMAVAPILGGFINESIGWRGSYILVAATSIIAWIFLYLWLPETKKELNALNIKQISLDVKKLFLNEVFLLSSLLVAICGAGWMSFVACASFLYIETYGLSIMHYTMHQASIITVFSVCSLLYGKLVNIIGEKKCITYGAKIILFSGVLMIFIAVNAPKSPYLTTLSIMVYSVGAAILYPVIFAKSLEAFPQIKGTASSAIMAIGALIRALFVAVSSYIYSGQFITVALMILIAVILINLCLIKLLKLMRFDTKES